MMWTIDLPSNKLGYDLELQPTEVLYEFDGPQIFFADFGFVQTIFVKADDLASSCLWTVARVEDKTARYVLENKVSVRCPFMQDFIWIVRTDESLQIIDYWSCEISSVPEDMLPAPGATLDGQTDMPDSVAQADAFFALQFKGENIHTYGSMRFSRYKALLDNAYEAVRGILEPKSLAGSRSNIYDFEVRQAAGSIIIAVEKLILNQKAAEKRLKQSFTAETMNVEVEYQRDIFLEDIREMVTSGFNAKTFERHFESLDLIHQLIPNKDSEVSSVTFSVGGNKNVTTIDRTSGERLKGYYEEYATEESTQVGRIEIINSKRHSFVILSEISKRQVTCYIERLHFDELRKDSRFRNGVRISVSGDFWERPNRDAIEATAMPRIIS